MNIFNCDPKWPICLFDFTYKNKVPNFFCFRVRADLSSFIVADYFGGSARHSPKKTTIPLTQEQDLLIERNIHLCSHSPQFVPNFKTLFNTHNDLMFKNPCMYFQINNENQIRENIDIFQD